MSPDLQEIIVFPAVAAAALYVIFRISRKLFGSGKNVSCGSCGCDSTGAQLKAGDQPANAP